jgi:homeobox-leucine zipper protein
MDCGAQGLPEFMFANRAGLDMLETTSGDLQNLVWEKTLDEEGQKTAYTDFTLVLQQVGFSKSFISLCSSSVPELSG